MSTQPKVNYVENLLRDARHLVSDRKNWIKGSYTNGQGGYCTVGALRQASVQSSIPDGLRYAAQFFARDVMETVIGGPNIANWNDKWNRRHSDVLRAFDKAIDIVRKQG